MRTVLHTRGHRSVHGQQLLKCERFHSACKNLWRLCTEFVHEWVWIWVSASRCLRLTSFTAHVSFPDMASCRHLTICKLNPMCGPVFLQLLSLTIKVSCIWTHCQPWLLYGGVSVYETFSDKLSE